MKKMITLLTLLIGVSLVFAQLEINVPFDTNVVGQAWNGANYTFQSEYFFVTNTGATSEFTITVTSSNLPNGWNLMWCHEIEGEGGCNFNPSLTIDFPQNVEVQLDFILAPVSSAANCDIEFRFESTSLPEPEALIFHFRTADASNADEMSLVQPQIELLQNYPNPFNPSTTIEFSTEHNEHIKLTIFNLKGQKVKTLVNEKLNIGNYSILWNGKDDAGKYVPSGTYFYKLADCNYLIHKKMILMK
jgi:hypothetical protein